MTERENWHSRLISEITARLAYLRGSVTIEVSKDNIQGADIRVATGGVCKVINIEVQQFDSGGPWKTKTLPSWKRRHSYATIVVFTEPTLERVLSNIGKVKEYNFFNQKDVYLFADTQLAELISFIGTLVLTSNIGENYEED